jgi:hypothetical protein
MGCTCLGCNRVRVSLRMCSRGAAPNREANWEQTLKDKKAAASENAQGRKKPEDEENMTWQEAEAYMVEKMEEKCYVNPKYGMFEGQPIRCYRLWI